MRRVVMLMAVGALVTGCASSALTPSASATTSAETSVSIASESLTANAEVAASPTASPTAPLTASPSHAVQTVGPTKKPAPRKTRVPTPGGTRPPWNGGTPWVTTDLGTHLVSDFAQGKVITDHVHANYAGPICSLTVTYATSYGPKAGPHYTHDTWLSGSLTWTWSWKMPNKGWGPMNPPSYGYSVHIVQECSWQGNSYESPSGFWVSVPGI